MPATAARTWGDWEAIGQKPLFTSAMSIVWKVRRISDTNGPFFARRELRYPKNPDSTAYERFMRRCRKCYRLKGPV
jgi:hypothetical protein